MKEQGIEAFQKLFGSGTSLYGSFFVGWRPGCIGETSGLLLVLGGLYLLYRRYITWHIPVSILGTIAVLTWIFGGRTLFSGDPLLAVLSGGAILGALYMATDYVTSPANKTSQILYGVGIGALTVLIRLKGGYPEGICYAIMKDILTIVFRLTLSCLMAATVMGAAFIITDKAKKHNEHAREERTMYSLLGYGKDKPVPTTLALHQIYRYIITEPGRQLIGYMVPTKKDGKTEYSLVALDMDGKLADRKNLALDGEQSREKEAREQALRTSLGAGKEILFADETIVVTDNGKRAAYILGGKFPGFKTFINVMLAIDQNLSMLGVEVLEHEEDPGLGAEIEKPFFKNQFKKRSLENLKGLQVVKEPLPEQYRQALEGQLADAEAARVLEQFKDKHIYALTGATISSRWLTDGVKGIVVKFAYRLDLLDRVLKEQKIAVAF